MLRACLRARHAVALQLFPRPAREPARTGVQLGALERGVGELEVHYGPQSPLHRQRPVHDPEGSALKIPLASS